MISKQTQNQNQTKSIFELKLARYVRYIYTRKKKFINQNANIELIHHR